MGHVYGRASGRGWRLRRRSLALWRQWHQELLEGGHSIGLRDGLLMLASDAAELERLIRVRDMRGRQGIVLDLWDPQQLESLTPPLPVGTVGGLHSPLDGQVDPVSAMAALRDDGLKHGLSLHRDAVSALEALPGTAAGWRVHGRGGDRFCLLYTSPSPRDATLSRMPSSA